ncbi:hypothetical protein [Corallococcus sp. AB011P]|uniref:hypothetical protein n=1 Tax=Corallococcus sp. AB011P TaxID=2316735 RepID=UPI0011C46179|nr:hypothetical protein [Corallococcus sp. AB011P]
MNEAVLHTQEEAPKPPSPKNELVATAEPATQAAALPGALTNLINSGMNHLENNLRCASKATTTHHLTLIEGWGDNQATIDAIAAYFVGLLATAVTRALQVKAQIENTQRDRTELLLNVEAITGTQSKPLGQKQKTDERNPWMAECLWHLCTALSQKRNELHPPGRAIALDLPHIAAKDHGFDVVALYMSDNIIGMSFIECKAYEKNPNGAISDAVRFFRDFDNGRHDARARQTLSTLREALPADQQKLVSPSLWKDVRAYLPNPHYDATIAMDWTNPRPSFGDLAIKKEQIALMPHAVTDFSAFFDAIGASMLKIAEGFSNV